jgi:hypothetical protein
LAVVCVPAGAQTEGTPTISVPRVTRAPKLSDFLTGTAREAETVITDFRQMDPTDGEPVSQPTAAYLSYDEKNLYAAFVAKDDPKKIRAWVAKRKQILNDDRITINIDTFDDNTHAYWFDVNPYAVQLDGITTDGQGDDFSWEGLWYTDAKITADGYVVLVTIPFKTIRFPDAPTQKWGVMLGRFIQRNNEFSMWPYITRRKFPQFVAQFGHMTGMENISPGRNVQFIPYAMGSGQKYLDRPIGAPPAMVTEGTFRGGVDGKVVIKDALTLDMTFNPDFSQVESDEPQVTVNQRFEVFFPERRPFFMENASYFVTPINLFFSRRIADPEYGIRLTGKLGKWGIGGLVADDRAPGMRYPQESPFYKKRATDAVISIQRDLWKDSHLRLMATDSEFETSFNRVASLDTRLRLKGNLFLTGQAVGSRTQTPEGLKYQGNAYFARLAWTDRKVSYYSSYADRGPGFRAALGYIPRVDVREFKNRIGYTWWKEKGALVNLGTAVVVLGNWNRLGEVQDWQVSPEFSMKLKKLTSLTVSHSEMYELFQGQGFRQSVNNFIASTEWYKWMAVEASWVNGTAINYYPAAGLVPFRANTVTGNLSLTFRPTPRLRLDETYLYSNLRTRPGWDFVPVPSAVFTNHIARSKLNYQFTRALSFRAIVDYNAILPNETLVQLERQKKFGYDFLMTYLVHPGTAVYVGYSDVYQSYLFDPMKPPYLQYSGYPGLPTGRLLFVKMSYLFRF